VTAAPGDVDWEETFDSGGNDFARDLVVAADGSTVYVTGRSELDTPDFATVAFDAATGWVLGPRTERYRLLAVHV
jgi:hypothetical protein